MIVISISSTNKSVVYKKQGLLAHLFEIKIINASRTCLCQSNRHHVVIFQIISKLWNCLLLSSYHIDIWQASRQHCCRDTCQISKWSEKSKSLYFKFKSSRFNPQTLSHLVNQRSDVNVYYSAKPSRQCNYLFYILLFNSFIAVSDMPHWTFNSVWCTMLLPKLSMKHFY